MSLLLETSLGDITIDLDIEGSPLLCKNLLKLAKARYYTSTLIYNVQEGRFCQMGDPRGDGTGGCCIDGLIDVVANTKKQDVRTSSKRFMRSSGVGRALNAEELQEKGRVVAVEMGMKDTVGSQFMITIDSGEGRALDSMAQLQLDGNASDKQYLSIGMVTEDDDDVLGKINGIYCDKGGRPYADIRIHRMHILDDPFEDPPGLDLVLSRRNVTLVEQNDLPENYEACRWLSSASPSYEKPKEEVVEMRISAEEAVKDVDEETEKKRAEEIAKKEDRSNAVMLEMLGDLPSADMKPPENVLFVCKLNPVTEDEDLELIFSRFDPNAKAEIIRDYETGDSLQYAFVEFDTEQACNEAYFKMNNALIDDRRIMVDFSQSVAKEWNRYAQRKRGGGGGGRGRGPPPHHESNANRPGSAHGNNRRNKREDNMHVQKNAGNDGRQYDAYGRTKRRRSRSVDRFRGRDDKGTNRNVGKEDRYERSGGHPEHEVRSRSRSDSRSCDISSRHRNRDERHREEKRHERRDSSRRKRETVGRSRSRSLDRSRYRKGRSRSESTSPSRDRDRMKRRSRDDRRKGKERKHRDRDRDRRKKRHKHSSRRRSTSESAS